MLNPVQGFGVHHVMNPDPYRGPFGADGKLYANDLANLIESATPGRIAGFFHETIQVLNLSHLLHPSCPYIILIVVSLNPVAK